MQSLPMIKKKPVKIGQSMFFSIPRIYIKNKLMDSLSNYDIEIYHKRIKVTRLENQQIIKYYYKKGDLNYYYIKIPQDLLKNRIISKGRVYDLIVRNTQKSDNISFFEQGPDMYSTE